MDARSKKQREATLVRADGVVRSAKVHRPEDFAGLTTPSAALRLLRIFLLMPQPPLLFKEGNVARCQFIHTLKTAPTIDFDVLQHPLSRRGICSPDLHSDLDGNRLYTECTKPMARSNSVQSLAGCPPPVFTTKWMCDRLASARCCGFLAIHVPIHSSSYVHNSRKYHKESDGSDKESVVFIR